MRRPYAVLVVLILSLLLAAGATAGVSGAAPPMQNEVPGAQAVETAPEVLLRLRGGTFDPRTTEPSLASAARRDAQQGAPTGAPTGAPALYLVQFSGPVQDKWYTSLLEAGLEVVSYIPDYAYLVWGEETSLAGLEQTTAARWAGTYRPAYALHPDVAAQAQSTGPVDVIVQVYDFPGADATVQAVLDRAEAVLRPPQTILKYRNLAVRVAGRDLAGLAALPGVINVEPRPVYEIMDEIQGQIIAGNLNAGGTAPVAPGYLAWLLGLGFPTDPAAYPVVDVTDDGIDNGSPTPLHPDFYGSGNTVNPARLVYNANFTSDAAADSAAGHGNINASIVAGYNDGTGAANEDTDGYNYGLGINPFGRVAGSKVFCNNGNWCLLNDNYPLVLGQGYANGTRVSSNSWGATTAGAYTADDQAYDALVRDISTAAPGNQEMVVVFSAGNTGPAARTMSSPGNAKNVITVGAAENYRPADIDGCRVGVTGADNAQDIIAFSSRGPTSDGRAKPDLVAPGTHVMGAASQGGSFDGSGICGGPDNDMVAPPTDAYWPAGQTLYTWSSGTSHAAPAVAGAASLLSQYYSSHFGGLAPSPAMTKAYLVNSARYLGGTGANDTLPSNNQGFGAVWLGRAFDNAPRILVDQSHVLGNTGEIFEIHGRVANPGEPLRVTLAWTDAPGSVVGASYVNNLDLEVLYMGQVYRGNVFNGAASVSGGTADPRNNVESVFLSAAQDAVFTVRILASNIAGDGLPGNTDPTDQDFALVIYNGTEQSSAVEGYVMEAPANSPLAGAAVQAITGTVSYSATTDATGYYSITLPPDTYTLRAWKFGYSEPSTQVEVQHNQLATANFTLSAVPTYALSGCLTGQVMGAPISGTVTLRSPIDGAWETRAVAPLPSGCYALTLPAGSYTAIANARLHVSASRSVALNADKTEDFALAPTTSNGLLWGYIKDASSGAPVPGATLSITPGSVNMTAGAGGYYEAQLAPGTYAVTVSAPPYATITQSGIVVPQSNMTRRDFALLSSQLNAVPAGGLSVTVAPGAQATRALTLTNTGQAPLSFTLAQAGAAFTPAATLPAGGPDAFGYTFHSSRNGPGSEFAWIDATPGTALGLRDDGSAEIALPFPFSFYGVSRDRLNVSNNGVVWFPLPGGAGEPSYLNSSLSVVAVGDWIAAFWDDLTATAGGVYYRTIGTAPNRRLVIEWHNLPHYSSSGGIGSTTFEAVLYEGTNNIKLQYQDVSFEDAAYDAGASATSGIRAGAGVLQFSHNSPALIDGMAICFQYPGSMPCDHVDIPWLKAAPSSGTVNPGQSVTIQVVFDAGALQQEGVYSGALRVYSNDPAAQLFATYPVVMTVARPNPAPVYLPHIQK